MSVVEVLAQLGGRATRSQLRTAVTRGELRRAEARGEVVRNGRGRYVLPTLDRAESAAHLLHAVLVLRSAALWHGWELLRAPTEPQLGVRRGRKLAPERVAGLDVHHLALHADDVVAGICTSKEKTLEQCLRLLPEDEALAIADSAARHEGPALLHRTARSVRGAGAARVRRLLAAADDRADNPFESALRFLALQVPDLDVRPQRTISLRDGLVRPDLVDEDLRIVLEADSFAWHGDRGALHRDARRYDRLVAEGWIVLRVTWEMVMFEPDQVVAWITAVTARRTQAVNCPRCAA